MIEVQDFPPMFEEIDAAFNVKGKRIIFAWGGKIYNPMCCVLTPALIAHETIHSERQGGNPEPWWKRYIADQVFRYEEEILAHRAEYRRMILGARRNDRRRAEKFVAGKLAAPLYGGHMTIKTARDLLKGGLDTLRVAA